MEYKIKDAFQAIKAEDKLKAETKAFIYSEMAKKNRSKFSFKRKWLYAVSLSMVLLSFFAGGYNLYFTPTAVISMDINPSIELDINRFDKVIDVNGYNDDGTRLAQSLDVLYLDYTQAIDAVIQSEQVAKCLAQDEFLSIAVVQIDEEQGEAILQYVSACTANHANAHCYGLNQDQVAEAHSHGLSYGKYNVYLQLSEYLDINPEDVAEMTMRELRDLLTQYTTEIPLEQHYSNGHGQHGNHTGQGKKYAQ